MSDSLGSENLAGSDSTSAARQSFGKPNPIVDPSFEKERKTMRPTRNLIRPRTNASLLRGSVLASSWTSATMTGTRLGCASGTGVLWSRREHDRIAEAAPVDLIRVAAGGAQERRGGIQTRGRAGGTQPPGQT